ncbi:ComF family protein [Streptomyces sp. NPDC050145]|uniref:ComF family protein n=1 Tax=Streptomyces sp. NPDC050145 TaxID=3365602 RepID=UPI003789AF0C
MRGVWGEVWGLVLPVSCSGCGEGRMALCGRCAGVLDGRGVGRVRPRPEPVGLPVVHAAAAYEGSVRGVLLDHKERGALGLVRPLGAALAAAVRAGGERGAVALVPMPSARRAVRARGHDPTLRITRAAAGALRRSGVPARVLAVLRQRRTPADQAGLDARQRLANVAGVLEVVEGGAGLLAEVGRIVLVDDLMTTGASLAEAARAVRAAFPCGTRSITLTGGTSSAGEKAARIALHGAVIAASPDSFEVNRN